MVDIHSHVLYGLDDGPATLEESVTMVRLAAENGTTDLVATPHANHEYNFDPELIGQRIEEIGAASQGVLRLHRGCDVHLNYENIEDAVSNPAKYAINGEKYLLVEFSDILIFHNTGEIFGRFLDAGLIPVITHPERNVLLRKRIADMAAWVEKGACVQITGQSLTGDFGKNAQGFCRDLLDKGLVHFVASDAHDPEHRPPRLDQAYAWLSQNYGQQSARLLCEINPRAALTGDAPQPMAAKGSPPVSWLKFWR